MPASDSESTARQVNAQTHEPVIGIDLGTTNSLVAVSDERGPRIIADGGDPRLVSSVVGFPLDGDAAVLVGAQAIELAEREPERVVASAKRLMGRSRAELEGLRHVLPLALSEGPRGMATVQVAGNNITPQEVSAHILRALRTRAECALGRTVSRAVITVPAYFDDAQRHATRDAARLAGLSVARIVNEPTAAALAYGLLERTKGERIVVVYDLGGGTFDVSVLRMLGKGHDPEAPEEALVEVVATSGDTQLGGDDFTGELVDAILESVDFDLARREALSALALGAVRVAAESLKCALSDADSAAVTVQLEDPLLPPAINFTIDRAMFDARIASRIACTIDACRNVLADAQLTTDEVERVILVGGSTRVPAVREAVKLFFGREAYSALDPDEVVALGAAVQGSILSGDRQDLLLLDVLALSLGIETVGGAVAKLLMRNSAVPAQATEQFSTSVDGQTSVRLHVLQGERELVEHCRSLGVMHLRDIPPMPAGIPKIEVEFNVDTDGVLSVHAVERRSDRRASIQVVPSHGLTDEEIEQIENDSFAHARQDMHLHRIIDLRVNAALDLKWTRSALARVQGVIDPELARTIESICAELEDEIKNASDDPASVDADRFHALKERLAHESVPMQEAAITESLRLESE